MTRTISINAHDLDQTAWDNLVRTVEDAVKKAREAKGGSTVGGNVYDSHATPTSRNL